MSGGRVLGAVALVGLLALTGCVAIPLSTLWKLHDMTAERFFGRDPRPLRVALRVEEGMKRGAGSPQIRIDIDPPNATRPLCYAFDLDAVDPRAAGELPLETAVHRRWYAFALSQRGIEAFDRARREVRTKDLEDADIALNVTMTDVVVMPEVGVSTPMRLDIALDRKDGYFTLIKETDVTVSKEKQATVQNEAKSPPPARDAKTKRICVPTA